MLGKVFLGAAALTATATASATPSTVFWSPATTSVQPYLVPHITYDTYFGKDIPSDGGSPVYPVTTGLTMGVLPLEKLNLEVGFDLLLPGNDPLLLNAKLGVPEGAVFDGSPSIAAGVFGVGTKSGVTDYHIVYGQVQKNLPWGGFASAGGYYGAGSANLWTGSDGSMNRAGLMAGAASPDIHFDLPGLKKLVVIGDVQTGKNVYGAGGVALSVYFTDAIDLITGPVFFFDDKLQPGKASWLWSLQLDVDVTLFESKPAQAASTASR